MKLTVNDIRTRVNQIESEKQPYRKQSKQWRKMWALQAFQETKATANRDGREQVVTPDPYDTVTLGRRLLSSSPKIEVPIKFPDDESEIPAEESKKSAQKRQKWLEGLWDRTNREQGRNVIGDLAWQALVLGRMCIEIKWIGDQLSDFQSSRRLPILIRSLDPDNVGVKRGPLGPIYAFHKYEEDKISLQQRYPRLSLPETNASRHRMNNEEQEFEVIDFWWAGKDGQVWNAIVVGDEFAKKPAKTDYKEIPIIESFGETQPVQEEEYKSLSVLHGMNGLWQYQCRLLSQLGTAIRWYTWPAIMVQNERGIQVVDLNLEPGTTTNLPPGTRVETLNPTINQQLSDNMTAQIGGHMQRSTFPGVMFGEAPGQVQAGFAVNMLTDAARGRINPFKEALEWTVTVVNEMALSMVEEFAEGDGVDVWGYDSDASEMRRTSLTADDIEGCYENRVTLSLVLPSDDIQRQTLGLRWVESGIVSRETYRRRMAGIDIPQDEQHRVDVEQALANEQLAPVMQWDSIIKEKGLQWLAEHNITPPGYHMMPDGTLMSDAEMQQQQAEQEQAMMNGMVPPEMMPPDLMGGPPMPPPEMMGGMPPPIQPDQGALAETVLPPQMAGQLDPESMGLPADLPPEIFDQLMGQPAPPARPTLEELEEMERRG